MMKNNREWLTVGLTIVTVGLAACDTARQDNRICTTPMLLDVSPEAMVKANQSGQDPVYQSEQLTQCVHRWAYRLAPSNDTAKETAEAALMGCKDIVTRYGIALGVDRRNRGQSESGFDLQGREVNSFEEAYRQGMEQALFHVVQARAGKCAVPE
jgi:hypothetical protein